MKEATHIMVHGRVQGVWFRAGTKEKADELGLLGWVKNRPEGTVEIHVEGEKLQLEKFIAWCRLGPPAADVTSLDIDEVIVKEHKYFDIHS
jgi:acylphosphatase